MFDIKIDGLDTIDTDFNNFTKKVNKGINYGLKAFASELTPCLQRHIQTDVYSAYTPQDYERRYDHPQYGRSIYHSNNMEFHFTAGGKGVEFTYEPQGRNTRYSTSPYYADGDSIIKTIQNGSSYLWNGVEAPKRPFWDKFVQDVIGQGDSWFVKGFNQYDGTLQAVSDRTLSGEASDYKLEPTGEIKRISNSGDSDND